MLKTGEEEAIFIKGEDPARVVEAIERSPIGVVVPIPRLPVESNLIFSLAPVVKPIVFAAGLHRPVSLSAVHEKAGPPQFPWPQNTL